MAYDIAWRTRMSEVGPWVMNVPGKLMLASVGRPTSCRRKPLFFSSMSAVERQVADHVDVAALELGNAGGLLGHQRLGDVRPLRLGRPSSPGWRRTPCWSWAPTWRTCTGPSRSARRGSRPGRPSRSSSWAGCGSWRTGSSAATRASAPCRSPCSRPGAVIDSLFFRMYGDHGLVDSLEPKRWSEKTTSAAVSGSPLWNLMPLRMLNVHVRPSGAEVVFFGDVADDVALLVERQQGVVQRILPWAPTTIGSTDSLEKSALAKRSVPVAAPPAAAAGAVVAAAAGAVGAAAGAVVGAAAGAVVGLAAAAAVGAVVAAGADVAAGGAAAGPQAARAESPAAPISVPPTRSSSERRRHSGLGLAIVSSPFTASPQCLNPWLRLQN